MSIVRKLAYESGYRAGYNAGRNTANRRLAELESLCDFYKRFLIKAVEDLHEANVRRAAAQGADHGR